MNLPSTDLLVARLASLRQAMTAAGCDALLVTRRPHLFYLANFAGSAGALMVTGADLFLVLDFRYLTDARLLLSSPAAPAGATLVPVDTSYDEAIVGLLESVAPRVVGFEADDVSVARHAWLREHAPSPIDLKPTRRLVESLRTRKDAHEIEVLRRAALALSALVPGIAGAVGAGRAERDVAAAIEAAMRSSGFSKPAFDTIVGSGANGARPHATAGDRIIADGDLVVLDFGGVMDGYCVDMTRTVVVGRSDARAKEVHAAVLAAQQAAIDAVRPGVLTGDVDRAARQVLERRGLGEAFGHGTGHGLGIEVHEAPLITRLRPGTARGAGEPAPGAQPVEEGMVFTIEPGAYLPGWGGVRIEDDVLVTADGCEVLTQAPRDLLAV